MATKLVFDAATGETKTEPLTAEEIAQAETDATAAVAKQAADDAEALRVASFAEDPDLMPGLEEIKGQTAAGVDTHVDQLIVLGEGNVERLRAETQHWLRYIYKRQLKAHFNPDPLTTQLNGATIEAAKVRERRGK